MRKISTRAGFEFIFAAGIAAIFIIPTAVMAQSNKSVEISIANGDTIVNGKNIKDLNPQQRTEALKDMNAIKPPRTKVTDVVIIRRNSGDNMVLPPPPPDAPQYGDYTGGNKSKPLVMKRRLSDTISVMKFNSNNDAPMPPRMPMAGAPGRGMRTERLGFNPRNSQTFNYTTTDGTGISTRINYRLTDADHDATNELDITDIKLIPDFATGRTTIMFNLPARGTAMVDFMNSEGKVLWSERSTTESFNKTFALPLNGRYRLKVKQGAKVAMKDIFREE